MEWVQRISFGALLDVPDIRTLLDMEGGAGEILGFYKDSRFNAREAAKLAAAPTASEILKAVDKNMISTTSISTTRMVVHGRRASRKVSSINYSQGNDRFYSEYTSPPREKGTKMLKLSKDLWIYDPNTDRSVQISGNMLKQSVMGSDLSYEDLWKNAPCRKITTPPWIKKPPMKAGLAGFLR